MKGVKLCFGLSLLFFIMVGLSLSVSSDVNALRYEVSAIPISGQKFWQGGNPINIQPLGFHWFRSSQYDLDFAPSFSVPDKGRYFYSTYNFNDNICKYNGQRGNAVRFSADNNELTWQFDSYYNFIGSESYPTWFNEARCRQTSPFGVQLNSDLPHDNFADSSFYGLTPVTTDFYKSLLPYYYDYSHVYVTDDVIDDSNGVRYSGSLHMKDLLDGETIPSKFDRLIIPYDMANTSKIGPLTQGRQLTFIGVFSFPDVGSFSNTEGFSWSPLFLEHGKFVLAYDAKSEADINDNSSHHSETDCSLKTRLVLDDVQVEFTCDVFLEDTFEYLYPYLLLDLTSYSSISASDAQNYYIFQTNIDWSFASAFVVTDNDTTSSGEDWNEEPTGNNLDEAPGSASDMLPGSEDWFSSLVNGFNFNFINPFAPIFNLFNNNDSCANIPTLAGMLHSESSTVCPWFDVSTRNIVTPILGLSSMMLVFGFAVRWLGARSGNFIEDDGGVDSGGLHFQNKYRRSK